MQLSTLLVLLLGSLWSGAAGAAGLRVLGIFPLPTHSHFIMFKAMMDALVDRGHEVVVLSPFPSQTPRANYTDIDTSLGKRPFVSAFTFDMISPASLQLVEAWKWTTLCEHLAGNHVCREVFSMPEFRRVLDGGYGKFDVVISEVFGSDCWAAVPYKLGVPHIGMSSLPDLPWLHDRIGSVDNPSYIPNLFTDFRDSMTFWQRLENVAARALTNTMHRVWMEDGSDAVVRELLGEDVPPVRELVRNTSLVLLNRHVSIHSARPLTPNLVHVGGLHIKAPPGALPAGLLQWLDGAERGVVFFSLGSMMRADSMPPVTRDALLAAFATLPQRVLWKFESEGLTLPANVRVAKWLPQLDILAHPNTVLFITHGGLMGTMEALHFGVPMIGIPLFADQMSNIALYMSMGIAEKLELATLSKESTATLIRTMTTDSRYRSRAREMSALFRDRPRQAAEEAVWWTEYVVRHGAGHLRPRGADLPLHQYLLLDVAAFCAAVLAALLYILWSAALAAVSAVSPRRGKSKAA